MKILNWNTEWLGPGSRTGRFKKARELIAKFDADVICLTEARAQTMPADGHTIMSELSGAGTKENRGARKVVLWSRFGWKNIDTIGTDKLPEGRFVCATTECNGSEYNFVGMCIPYKGYRTKESWAEKRMAYWHGACEYLDALRGDVLSQSRYKTRAVLLGDFNLQIPPYGYPGKNSESNKRREATFDGWSIPTAGEWDVPALDKPFIDHVALTHDIRVTSLQFFSRFADDGTRLSDHNGVYVEIESC